jgi:hypothetical protein
MINMKGIEVSRQTCKEHNIGLRHGPAWALPLVTDYKIIE